MSLLTNPSELEAPNSILGMLYGQPGSGKTTCAISAPNPVLIDLDRGMHRVRPAHRVTSLQVESYDQILELLDGDELKPFDTIVFDTAGKLIDRMAEYIIKNNPKNRTGSGQLTMQGWGEVKGLFTALTRRLKLLNKSILFVAHESEDKSGEEVMKRPDIAGSARKDIVKELDFMGYMEMRGNKAVINFNPTDKFYAKNSLGLDAAIEVPELDEKTPNQFLAKYIFKASDAKLASEAALRKEYEALVTSIGKEIGELKNAEQVNKFYATMKDRPVIWDSVYFTRNELKNHVHKIGVAFDKETKQFKQITPEAKSADGEAAGEDKGTKPAKAPAKGKGKKAGESKAEVQEPAQEQKPESAASQPQPTEEISEESFSV